MDYGDRIYCKNGNIVSRKIADEMILVPIHGNLADMQKIFSLTPVAEFIWEHLDGKRSVKEIHTEVIQFFDVESETATQDITELIDRLKAHGLITENI